MSKGDPLPPLPEDAPKKGDIYVHYKGDKYRVTGMALHSSTDEWMVLYEPLYENAATEFFTRPLKEWQETVEWPARPKDGHSGGQGTKVARFVKV